MLHVAVDGYIGRWTEQKNGAIGWKRLKFIYNQHVQFLSQRSGEMKSNPHSDIANSHRKKVGQKLCRENEWFDLKKNSNFWLQRTPRGARPLSRMFGHHQHDVFRS